MPPEGPCHVFADLPEGDLGWSTSLESLQADWGSFDACLQEASSVVAGFTQQSPSAVTVSEKQSQQIIAQTRYENVDGIREALNAHQLRFHPEKAGISKQNSVGGDKAYFQCASRKGSDSSVTKPPCTLYLPFRRHGKKPQSADAGPSSGLNEGQGSAYHGCSRRVHGASASAGTHDRTQAPVAPVT
jgi:hypothetical protein